MRFIDEADITVRSGKGGRGCVSFRREKFIPKGGPDGGNGGKGGDVIFRASHQLLTLYDFRLKRVYEAENGQPGMGKQRYGRNGEDLVVEVPVGTLIYAWPREEEEAPEEQQPHSGDAWDPGSPPKPKGWRLDEAQDIEEALAALDAEKADAENADAENADADDGEDSSPHADPQVETEGSGDVEDEELTLLADLNQDGKECVVAHGGRGGKGNEHFKSSTMRAPRFAQPGEPAEELRIKLVLKVIADAGLLGLPNAGKSTFISRISAAKPKIAAYPFTTITPNLGVVMHEDDPARRLIVADIPGLIEGAHEGHGLGHRFLRHVERTRFLVHLLSCEDLDPADPWAGFDLLNYELAQYDPELALKPQLEVVNKIDLAAPETLAALQTRAQKEGREIFWMSALNGDGVEDVLDAMWLRLQQG